MPDMPGRMMTDTIPQLQNTTADVKPPMDRGDVTNLDEKRLANRIIQLFQNDIIDKEYFGWVAKRQTDIENYYLIKNEALRHSPWEGASNSRVPLTPVLLDTAQSNIMASLWPENGDPVKARGVAIEDIRKAPIIEDVMNWKVNNEMDMETPMDSNVFRTLLHGTGIVKVIRDFNNYINLHSIEIENYFTPIDAAGCKVGDTDHCIQVIPLTYNDLQERKPYYRDIDKVAPGIGISSTLAIEQLRRIKDIAFGTSLDQRVRRELFYIIEVYIEYYEKDSMRPRELIVWMSPNGGTIHRVRENKEKIRPFAEYYCYAETGRFFRVSLPEKIKGIQDDIDYAWKQNTDALDRAIMPAMFVDDTSGFDRQKAMRIPGGIYQKGKGVGAIEWEQVPPMERGFERQIQSLWMEAENITGLIDVTQGKSTKSGRPLGETEIRTARADIRFASVFNRFGKGAKKTYDIVYEYINRFEDRAKKLKVIGYNDVRSLGELFPSDDPNAMGLGIEGKYIFSLGGMPINEREQEKANKIQLYNDTKDHPLIQRSMANSWRLLEMRFQAAGVRNIDDYVTRPKEVNIYSVQEFIQRVMSGQYDIQVRPGIDTDQYYLEIELFMQTDTFFSLDPRAQKALFDAQRRAYMMGVAERQAIADFHRFRSGPPLPNQPQGQVLPQNNAQPNMQPGQKLLQ